MSMLVIALETYLLSRGLTPARALNAAEVVAPLVQGYLDAVVTCPPVPPSLGRSRWKTVAKPSPYPDIDAEFAATAVPSVTEVMNVPPDGTVDAVLEALELGRPRLVLLAGDDAPPIVRHFHTMTARQFCSGAGLVEYPHDPRGGDASESWLGTFLEQLTGQRVCQKCYAHWIDSFAEDYVRFLAVEDDDRAAMMEPYLRYLAPYVRCEGLTAGGDLLFYGRQ
jgi:hypothetical protein